MTETNKLYSLEQRDKRHYLNTENPGRHGSKYALKPYRHGRFKLSLPQSQGAKVKYSTTGPKFLEHFASSH